MRSMATKRGTLSFFATAERLRTRRNARECRRRLLVFNEHIAGEDELSEEPGFKNAVKVIGADRVQPQSTAILAVALPPS